MREILFRGKRTDNGAWVYGYLCKGYSMSAPHTFDGIMYENHSGINLAYMTAQIDPETVGQYTGLTDKNGTRIFEGDILKFSEFLFKDEIIPESFSTVFYSAKDGGWMLRELKTEYPGENISDESSAIDSEVIGNIYDNPELIGGVLNV